MPCGVWHLVSAGLVHISYYLRIDLNWFGLQRPVWTGLIPVWFPGPVCLVRVIWRLMTSLNWFDSCHLVFDDQFQMVGSCHSTSGLNWFDSCMTSWPGLVQSLSSSVWCLVSAGLVHVIQCLTQLVWFASLHCWCLFWTGLVDSVCSELVRFTASALNWLGSQHLVSTGLVHSISSG